MNSERSLALRHKLRPLFGAVACLLAFALPSLTSAADDVELADEEKACLKCHDKPGMTKKLDNGESLSMHISTDRFIKSMHNETSCEDCHEDIEADTHGKTKKSIESKRAHSLSYQESCRTCHKKNNAKYDDSLHAQLIRDGNEKAPLCTNCHDAHYVESVKIVQPIDQVACLTCHEKIGKAYKQDVHGQARQAKGKEAPICADCHSAHGVQSASLGTAVKDSCISCHEDAEAKHKDWLPNASRHFATISCPVCHAPNAKRRVNLRIFDKASDQQVAEKAGVPQFEMRAKAGDVDGTGLDQQALRSLLKDFSSDNPDAKITLRGRLEVQSGVDAHQLSKKEDAIKDCKLCHAAGSEPFQSVSVTVTRPDGRPLRHDVKSEVLNSLFATQSVGGFYAIGSTRIKLFDYALILAVGGTLAGVFGHWAIRRALRGYRERRKAARKAENNTPSGAQ